MKQKVLLPSLREKKRYLVYEVLSESKFSFKELKEVIIAVFRDLFGLHGLSIAGLEFIEYKENKGIVRVSTKGLDMLRASFCFVRKINKDDVVLRSLGVSGMLKKARNKFILGGEF
ncbi:hypothetical protein HYU23_02165 [Candidatus Woesearchaeota archaeon]|nr:hypothetical protein [Candidatus Woesearchaeota archaeon]